MQRLDLVHDSKDRGTTAVEYGLMLSLIAITIMAAVTGMTNKVISTYGQIAGVI